jgi:hypothetical protein
MDVSAKIVLLNQILADYGPETEDARDALRRTIANTIDEFWHSGGASPAEKGLGLNNVQTLYEKILSLNPHNDHQRSLREKALDISFDLEQARDLLVIQQIKHIPKTFLIVLVLLTFWFIFIFFGLGIYAPLNSTAVLMLALCALSVAIAFFMVIDLNLPFEGVLRMPSSPLIDALQ